MTNREVKIGLILMTICLTIIFCIIGSRLNTLKERIDTLQTQTNTLQEQVELLNYDYRISQDMAREYEELFYMCVYN